MQKIKKTLFKVQRRVSFKDIDRQLLEGFEFSQFNNQNKRFLSMIREQTNSARNNKKYWTAN